MSLGIVVVARQASTRLPLKHLYPLLGSMSLLEVLFERLGDLGDRRVLAVPSRDSLYTAWAKALGWDAYRSGFLDDEDVLGRVLGASQGCERIAIVNGDSPLIDPGLLRSMLEMPCDLVHSTNPSGQRPYVVTVRALEAWAKCVARQREHLFDALVEPPGISVKLFEAHPTAIKLSVDTIEDLEFIRGVISRVGIDATLAEIVAEAKRDRADNRQGIVA